jgi:hypothetical protein
MRITVWADFPVSCILREPQNHGVLLAWFMRKSLGLYAYH